MPQWISTPGRPSRWGLTIVSVHWGSLASEKHSLCTTMSKPLYQSAFSYSGILLEVEVPPWCTTTHWMRARAEVPSVMISFSPKELYSKSSSIQDERIWQFCSEIKFVIANSQAPEYLLTRIIPQLKKYSNNCPIFLVPDWFNMDANKKIIIELLNQYPNRLRWGVQMHKLVDMP